MPVYEIEHPKTGQKIRLEGDGVPTDSDIREAFAKVKAQPTDSRTPSYDNRVTDKAEIERGRKEFLANQGDIPSRLRNTSVSDMAVNALKEVPRLAQEAITVPLSSAKKGAYGLAALSRTGGEMMRGKSLDEALRTGTDVMSGYQPVHGPLDPSMTGEAVGTGIQKLSDLSENATGDTGWAAAGIQAGADIVGLVGGGKVLAKGGRLAADTAGKASTAVVGKVVGTPESLARSALKPYIGESVARQKQATKGVETSISDKNATARMPKFLKNNLAEMEDIAGRQEVLLNEKGNPAASIQGIRAALKGTVDEARNTPGTADAATAAADKVLNDITSHPAYDAATDSIPLNTVQGMKRNIWRKLRESNTFNKDAVPGLQDAMWDAATGMNDIINKHVPEMAGENARYGELANVNKLLKRSIDRHANNNIIPLRALIQIVRGDVQGFATGVSVWALDHPTIKMYLAQRMAKSRGGKTPSPKEVNAVVESIKADLVQRDQTVLDAENLPKVSNGNLGDTIPGGYQKVHGWEGAPKQAEGVLNPESLPARPQATNLGETVNDPTAYQQTHGWEGKPTQPVVTNPESLPGKQSGQMPVVSNQPGRTVPQVEAMTKRPPKGYNPETTTGRESQLGDRLRPDTELTWGRYQQRHLANAIKEEGSRPKAIKRLAKEYRDLWRK